MYVVMGIVIPPGSQRRHAPQTAVAPLDIAVMATAIRLAARRLHVSTAKLQRGTAATVFVSLAKAARQIAK